MQFSYDSCGNEVIQSIKKANQQNVQITLLFYYPILLSRTWRGKFFKTCPDLIVIQIVTNFHFNTFTCYESELY